MFNEICINKEMLAKYIYICVCVCVYNMVGWLAVFYDISIIVGYLMPNSIYTYVLYIWFVN